MIIIFRVLCRILAAAAVTVLLQVSAAAYDVVNLPNSMTIADALGIFDADEIASANIADLDNNISKELDETEIKDFYYMAKNITVWRKVNPTPFRGVVLNITTTDGARVNYLFNSGVQIGRYGVDNYICYMPAADDAVKLSYLVSDFYDSEDGIIATAKCNDCTLRDFLRVPDAAWASEAVSEAASKNLVPYEFTSLYGTDITREQTAVLIANFIAVAGNYTDMDAYMAANDKIYYRDNFRDAIGRDEAIDQLFALGIISGRDSDDFDPDANVTRAEFAAFTTRAAELSMYIESDSSLDCADADDVPEWARFFVIWNIDKGIFKLDDSSMFYPNDNITVEQAITALSRLYEVIDPWY